MNTGISQELQFIRWHRQYSSTPPTMPTTAVVTPTLLQPDPLHLPTKLATLPDQTCFNTFSLERTTQQANMEPQTVQGEPNIIEQTLLETLNSSKDENSETTFEQHEISDIIMSINESHFEPTIASQNKAITTNGVGLGQGKNILQNEHEKKIKRRRTKTGVRGSGRPTNDASIMHIDGDENEDIKTEAALALKELQQLTSAGRI
ncbi:Hypothetical predicted protein [Paramuricea clavata]|uniref:Uncharacterized protein n=1 Tax=Paramuricea clavata TaxID=317549 RepID=A0A7D9HT43_PARCT|nr:Hypothetical predicted protein [Paramuricea clavata]